MPPNMVAPMRVAVAPGSTPRRVAKASLMTSSPGRSGRRPRTTAFSKFNSRRSGLSFERRSMAIPAAGPWARVSPFSSGMSMRPPNLMR